MTPPRSMPVLRNVLRSAPLLAAALLLGACGGDGSDTVSVSEQSGDRPTTSAGPSGESDYCAAAEAVNGDGSGLDLSDDPQAALAGVQAMAAAAPAEIQDDFETFVDGIDDIAEMDQDDPEVLATIFELMADPEFSAAADAIEAFTKQECGIELGASMPSADGSSGLDADEPDDSEPGEIDLDDVAAVKEANASSAWADKLSTTAINGLADVQVSTSGDDLSQAEALEACTTLLAELSKINPDVTLSVGNGAEVLATSGGGTCAAA